MKSDIKTIIFDFGGVILNIDHQRVENAFRKLGIKNFEELYGRALQTELFRDFETGKISAHMFRNGIREITGRPLSDDVIDYTWNQIILDYPDHRIDILRQVKENYKTYILSNTNVIHYHHYIFMFWDRYKYDFNTLFDRTFWSFKIGKRKPDDEAYLHVMDQTGQSRENIIFIDDTLENIEAARQLQIPSVYLEPGSDISGLFDHGQLRPETIDKALKMK